MTLLLVDEDSMPNFERQQRPKPVSVVALAAFMLGDEPAQGWFVEVSARQCLTTQKRLLQIAVQTGTKPPAHRHAEAMLFPTDNFLRDNILKGPFQNVFRGHSLELEFRWNAAGEL